MIRRILGVLVLTCTMASTHHLPVSGAQAAVTRPAEQAALQITPDEGFLGGQSLHWTGNIGVSGVRTITMQKYLGREGDDWEEVRDFEDETDAAGDFAYWYPAPAMQEIEYRVVSGSYVTPNYVTPSYVTPGYVTPSYVTPSYLKPSYVTPSVVPHAVQPDLVLWVTGKHGDDPDDIGKAVAGQPFGISVDTTPELYRRPDTEGSTPIPGRKLTLQRRVEGREDKWHKLGTTKVDENGLGYFTGVTEQRSGEVVYRVREENWFKGRDEIGWFPSFPTYIKISAPGAEVQPSAVQAGAVQASAVQARAVQASAVPLTAPRHLPGIDPVGTDALGGTASQKYDWPAPFFDFAWAQGESLTSPPSGGTRREGWWLDYSDGGGRLSKDGGGLILDSKRVNASGPGDFGTTKGTLRENPITFGRWETKLSATAEEGGTADYRLRLELVPNRAPDDACRTITVAEFTDHGQTMNFGVNAVDSQWTGHYQLGQVDHATFAFAIEVTRDHITWFVNAEPIGTVKDRRAAPGVPLTLRLSMVGDGDREMNKTELKSDWQRGFSLEHGKQVSTGPSLSEGALEDC